MQGESPAKYRFAGVGVPPDLVSGLTYDGQLVATLPDGISGPYHLIVRTGAGDTFEEGALDGNNTRPSSSFNVDLAAYPDLETTLVTTPAPVIIGDPVDLTVSWTVTNQGSG